MKGEYTAIMEHGSQVTDPVLKAKIAQEMSDKLLRAIRTTTTAQIKEMVEKYPEDSDKYVVPVTKVHLTAARGVPGADEPGTTANSVLGLLERVYNENKAAGSKKFTERLFATRNATPQL